MQCLACVFRRAREGVGEVVGSARLVPIHAHGAVALVVADAGVERAIDGDLLVVGAEAVAVGVSVGEETSLKEEKRRKVEENKEKYEHICCFNGVAIGGRREDRHTNLEHLIRRGLNARHHVGRGKSQLLHFSEVVGRVAVEDHAAYFLQGVVLVGPDLGQVEGVEGGGLEGGREG